MATSPKELADAAHDMQIAANKLATGFAELGADEQTVATFKQCGEIAAKAVKAIPGAPGAQPEAAGAAPAEEGAAPETMESATAGMMADRKAAAAPGA